MISSTAAESVWKEERERESISLPVQPQKQQQKQQQKQPCLPPATADRAQPLAPALPSAPEVPEARSEEAQGAGEASWAAPASKWAGPGIDRQRWSYSGKGKKKYIQRSLEDLVLLYLLVVQGSSCTMSEPNINETLLYRSLTYPCSEM